METHIWVYRDIPAEIPNSLVAQEFTPEIVADIFQTGTLSVFKHNGKLHILAFEKYCYQGENVWHKQYIKGNVDEAHDLVILLRQKKRGDEHLELTLNKIRKQLTMSDCESKLALNKARIDYDDLDGSNHEVDMDLSIATLKLAKKAKATNSKQTEYVNYKLPEFVFKYNIIGRICELEEQISKK